MLTFLRPGGLACCCSAPFVSAVNSTDGSSALTCHNRKRTSAFWFRRSAIVSVKSPVFTHWLSNLLAVVLSLCQDEIWGFLFLFFELGQTASAHTSMLSSNCTSSCHTGCGGALVQKEVMQCLHGVRYHTFFFFHFFCFICFMVATNCSATCCM